MATRSVILTAGRENGLPTPDDPEALVKGYWRMHPGGVNFQFADGAVQFVKAPINRRGKRRIERSLHRHQPRNRAQPRSGSR